MAYGSYNLGEGNQTVSGKFTRCLFLSLIVIAALSVVAIVLSSVALSRMSKNESPVVHPKSTTPSGTKPSTTTIGSGSTTPIPTPTPRRTDFNAILDYKSKAWDEDYKDKKSAKSVALKQNLTNVIMDALGKKYNDSHYMVDASISDFQPKADSTQLLNLEVLDNNGQHVEALANIVIKVLEQTAKDPTSDEVADAINVVGNPLGIHANVTEVVATTTVSVQTTSPSVQSTTTTSKLPPAWYDAADYLKASMNLSHSPCDDFYQYVCGGWIDRHPRQPHQPDYLVFTKIQDLANTYINKGMESVTQEDIEPLRETKTAYSQCNTSGAADEGLKRLDTFITDLGGLPFFDNKLDNSDASRSIPDILGKLFKNHGATALVQPAVRVDVGANISRNALLLNQGTLIKGNRDYYVDKTFADETKKEITEQIRNITLVYANFRKIGPEKLTKLNDFVEKVYEIEEKIATISVLSTALRDHSSQYNPRKVSELVEEFSSLNFETYLKSMLIDEAQWIVDKDHYVIMSQLDYFTKLDSAMSDYSTNDMVNYLLVRLMFQYGSEIEGSVLAKERDCPAVFVSLLPWTTGRVYVQARDFSNESRKDIDGLVQEIQLALNSTVEIVDFLDEGSRQNASKKVNNILRNPGFPDWIMDDQELADFHKGLKIEKENVWLATWQTLQQWSSTTQMRKLNQPVDRTDFQMSPAWVNAWYEPEFNSISFPAAILTPPFFRLHGPRSLNFGGIGSVIGHELTHGFDDEGVQYDWVGALDLWMDAQSQAGFRKMADCIVDEYSNFCFNDSGHTFCLNGKTNQGENIADNGGIRQSYKAYEYWLKTNPEPKLPGFEQLSHEQLFFIGFGSVWCGTETKAYDEKLILTNPHSPPRYRVHGTVQNMDEFAKAFNCKAGSKFDPPDEQKCYVWANGPTNTTTSTTKTSAKPVTTMKPESTTTHNLPTAGHTSPTAGHTSPTAGHSSPTAGHTSPTAGHTSPTAGHTSPTAGHTSPTAGHTSPTAGHTSPTAGHTSPTAGYSLPTTDHSLPTTDQRSPTTPEHRLPPAWYEASRFLESAMNTSVDPCDSFYHYVCGNWMAAHPLEPGEPDVLVLTELQETTNNMIDQGIQNIDSGHDIQPLTIAKIIYSSCNGSAPSEDGTQAILSFIDSLGGFPFFEPGTKVDDPKTLARLMANLFRLHGIAGLISPQIEPDAGGNVTKHTLILNQAPLLLGPPEVYLNETAAEETQQKIYLIIKNLTAKLAEHSGKEMKFSENVSTLADRVFNIEVDLAKISVPSEKLRNHSAQWNLIKLDDLKVRSLDLWYTYIQALLYEDAREWLDKSGQELVVAQLSYFDSLADVLKKHDDTDLVNYLFVKLIFGYGGEIFESVLATGDRKCLQQMIQLLPWATGRIFIRESGFSNESREEIDHLVEELQSTLNDTMASVDILDDKAKKLAQKKAENIRRNPGYPDWIMNDESLTKFHADLEPGTGDVWVITQQELVKWFMKKHIKLLLEPVDRGNFLQSPGLVNAWYVPQYNSISFPAAILQKPVFRAQGPMSLNFGAIGTVIGHEMTHGFDDQGVQFDWDGRLDTWMDSDSRKGFRKMADCIVDEYNDFCFYDGSHKFCLDGTTNQGENIADNGGIRQAYKAYQTWSAKHPEPKLPGFEDLTHEQLFFMGFASTWCGTETKAFDEHMILTNPHSPPRYRVHGTLQNMKEFADAFNCTVGSKMNPIPDDQKCYVWANSQDSKK